MPTEKRHVAFINTHPIQYFAPLYAYLNAADDLRISTLYLSDYSVRGAEDKKFGRIVKWDVDLLRGYDARFVHGANRRGEASGFWSMLAPSIWKDVRSGKFDALVVHGHTPVATLLAVLAAKSCDTPVFHRAETHLRLARSGSKRALRSPLLKYYYGQMAGVLSIGSRNEEFYSSLGVPSRRIFTVPYTVDNSRFIAGANLTDAERLSKRASLGVSDDLPILLYAAKLFRRKRPDDLLRAAEILQRAGLKFHTVLVGSGEMEGELKALVEKYQIERVRFVGFVNQASLPATYAASDIFVLPSDNEPWGLAVNEAMCAGLPIVLSEEIGCASDLVRHGENGHLFDAGDVEGLATALAPLIEDAELRRAMGEVSRSIISRWSYSECLTGLRAALDSIST